MTRYRKKPAETEALQGAAEAAYVKSVRDHLVPTRPDLASLEKGEDGDWHLTIAMILPRRNVDVVEFAWNPQDGWMVRRPDRPTMAVLADIHTPQPPTDVAARWIRGEYHGDRPWPRVLRTEHRQ